MSTDYETGDISAEDLAGLLAGMTGVTGLLMDVDTLEHLLTEVATFALVAIPGADGAGVTMLEAGHPDTIVASATFVSDVDAIQYRLGEGPCISAAAKGRTISSPALGEDDSWPIFGPSAAELGVHSAISLPLIANGEILGAINVYAHERGAFNESSERLGERFAASAAATVHNARTLDQARRTAARLEVALTSRATIDQAVGIVMSRSGLSSDDAFVRLRIISQHEHTKLTAVATQLVEEAVRRARLRTAEQKQ